MSSHIEPDPSVLTGITIAPFTRLPDPATVFAERARRLNGLAQSSELKPYLIFLRDLIWLQHEVIEAGLPAPDMPEAADLDRAAAHGMPPLERTRFTADPALETTFERFLAGARPLDKPEAAARALESVARGSSTLRDAMVRNVLADSIPVEQLAEHVYVACALQIHFARLAAGLAGRKLVPVADGACPCCGGPPAASLISAEPGSQGARYCACALCGTLWNYVRIKCTVCGATGGIGFQEQEGSEGVVKAETCDTCHSYLKVVYQAKDEGVDPIADDVASLGLDLLMKSGPYRRAGFNPFILGY